MQVRVFGLEEQSRMRGLDPKVRAVCACNVKYGELGNSRLNSFELPLAVHGL
jgi:hypothetical protein